MNITNIYVFISAHYQILMIIIFSLIGSTIKDIFDTLSNRNYKVKLTKIIISAITSSILMYSFTDLFLKMGFTSKMMVSIYFISGITGFNLLEKLNSLDGVTEFLNYIKDYFLKK